MERNRVACKCRGCLDNCRADGRGGIANWGHVRRLAVMTAVPTTSSTRNNNRFARERDALILRLLDHHPATASMLASIGLFPTRKKASERLARLTKRGRVRLLGTVSLGDGRPQHVYGRGRCKRDNLLHEVQLTRVCLRIQAEEVRRGSGEVDGTLLPDAELVINGKQYFLEMDCGTMSYSQVVRDRFLKYRFAEQLVLWVCPTDARREGLRRHAEMNRATALFTTFAEAVTNPHAPIWVDFDGGRAALPRNG